MSAGPIPDLAGMEVVHAEVSRVLRTKPGVERLRLAHEAWDLARERLTAFLAAVHPHWSGERVRQEVARRFLRDAG